MARTDCPWGTKPAAAGGLERCWYREVCAVHQAEDGARGASPRSLLSCLPSWGPRPFPPAAGPPGPQAPALNGRGDVYTAGETLWLWECQGQEEPKRLSLGGCTPAVKTAGSCPTGVQGSPCTPRVSLRRADASRGAGVSPLGGFLAGGTVWGTGFRPLPGWTEGHCREQLCVAPGRWTGAPVTSLMPTAPRFLGLASAWPLPCVSRQLRCSRRMSGLTVYASWFRVGGSGGVLGWGELCSLIQSLCCHSRARISRFLPITVAKLSFDGFLPGLAALLGHFVRMSFWVRVLFPETEFPAVPGSAPLGWEA